MNKQDSNIIKLYIQTKPDEVFQEVNFKANSCYLKDEFKITEYGKYYYKFELNFTVTPDEYKSKLKDIENSLSMIFVDKYKINWLYNKSCITSNKILVNKQDEIILTLEGVNGNICQEITDNDLNEFLDIKLFEENKLIGKWLTENKNQTSNLFSLKELENFFINIDKRLKHIEEKFNIK